MIKIAASMPAEYRDASSDELARRIAAAKESLGSRLLILGHHYQMDEVMDFADARGDSFGLSKIAAEQRDAEIVVFCGVHFMAESADILTGPEQRVILPDLSAGCSMADMADIDQVEAAWADLATIVDIERVVPITYMNSTAAIKAFVGRHGGAVCTSSNARAVLAWALGDEKASARGDRVFFLPDQHLGRNTALSMGYDQEELVLWDPAQPLGGQKLTPRHYAYLKISEGCDHKCSFCIIPSMRGGLASRPLSHLLNEAIRLRNAGVSSSTTCTCLSSGCERLTTHCNCAARCGSRVW